MNTATSTASAKPKTGESKKSDNLAPTVPLPSTNTSSTNSAFGNK